MSLTIQSHALCMLACPFREAHARGEGISNDISIFDSLDFLHCILQEITIGVTS